MKTVSNYLTAFETVASADWATGAELRLLLVDVGCWCLLEPAESIPQPEQENN